MGGGIAGNFGNTKGSSLDSLSNLLAAASIIPALDTVTNVVSIPVDLARGDFVSAGLDLLGAVPLVGEIADTAKLARLADKAVDAAKVANKSSDAVRTAKKATNFSGFPKNIHTGKQGKHIVGHNNYKKGKSILNVSTETAQKLVNKYSGTGRKIGASRERVNFKKVIGKYVDPKTGKAYDTTVGTIHYSNSGTHIVPEKPINWRK